MSKGREHFSPLLGKILAISAVYVMALGLWGVFSATVFQTTLATSGTWLLLLLPGVLIVAAVLAYDVVYIPWKRGQQAFEEDRQRSLREPAEH